MSAQLPACFGREFCDADTAQACEVMHGARAVLCCLDAADAIRRGADPEPHRERARRAMEEAG